MKVTRVKKNDDRKQVCVRRLAYTRMYFLFAGIGIKHVDGLKRKLNAARLAIRQCSDSVEANISANKISLPQGS